MPPHITMIKKRLADGTECAKCVDATAQLKTRGVWNRIDDVVWAQEDDPASPGMQLARAHDVHRAPFFIVSDDGDEQVYTSVLQLIRERLGQPVSAADQVGDIDADDLGI